VYLGNGSGVGAAAKGRVVLASAARLEFQPDLARASEVAFEFIAEGPESTRVEFEHRHLERHGEGWQKMREQVGSEGGWPMILELYVKATR